MRGSRVKYWGALPPPDPQFLRLCYKVIKILAVRLLGTKLMQIFKETTTSDEKLPGGSPGNDDAFSSYYNLFST